MTMVLMAAQNENNLDIFILHCKNLFQVIFCPKSIIFLKQVKYSDCFPQSPCLFL